MRKQPRQARSRQMVERIVAAGREVLVEDGYDAFSTNRVAAAAGISPGSLYQYFPDKTAILDVVVDRYTEQTSERVAAALSDRLGGVGLEVVRDIVDALLSALEADRALLRVVSQELPLARSGPRRAAIERRIGELASTYLLARPEHSRRPTPAVSTWVTVLAIENLAVRWVLDQPPITRDQILDEIVALVGGYLLS
ncbi:TetR/AcrR family transcriptional regulator [Nocardioides immobilis]|nr:TetR/AcrR family transcriptional regulator [Nocardioides immobilis]